MDMSLDDLQQMAELDIQRTYKVNKLDLWKIVHAHNTNKGEEAPLAS
jgi:hypothetical protein